MNNDDRITFRLPKSNKQEFEELAKEEGYTSGAAKLRIFINKCIKKRR